MSAPARILLFGASGSIGRATARELVARGHEVVCPVRPAALELLPPGARGLRAEVTRPESLRDVFAQGPFDAVISTLASRSGNPAEAWAVDHAAHLAILRAAEAAGVARFVLLSAICVQRPRLAFQHAKLAFEAELRASSLLWTIVRPTAYFKSLSGQIARLQRGKPYLVFGDGRLTACKPISDRDLATYLADCLTDPARARRILPIGGPGPAQTPREQGEALFALLGRPPRFSQVPVALLDGIIGGLTLAGRLLPGLRAKAELARIGRYYATESMLVWDEGAGRYDPDATPEFGSDRLIDHQARLIRGEVDLDLGEHAVF